MIVTVLDDEESVITKTRKYLIWGGCVLHGLAGSVFAQDQGRLANEDSGLLPWLITGGLIVIVCITAFINPKRTHLS